MKRIVLALASAGLLILAFIRSRPAEARQAAVSLSRPGQEDLTFWVNRNGLDQFNVEGEVGFGDMARILMRRRANAEGIRPLRDRFTFRIQDMAALDTPDVLRAELSGGKLAWRHQPATLVLAAGRLFNLPTILVNRDEQPARVTGSFFKLLIPNAGPATHTVTLRAGGRELSATLALDVRPLVRLRVHLLDHDGQPAAARVYLTASDGLAYTPRGHITRMTAMSAEYYFHAQDSFELDLPAGPTLIEATRGQEYEIASQRVELQPAQPAEVRLRLRRWENMAARGWFSADAHIHANYTAAHHQVITPDDVRLQTLAEDINNANLIVANSSNDFIHDQQFFEGRPHRLSRPNFVVYWNEEMRNAGLYGHMSFFNLKTLVHPIYSGFRDTPNWEDYPANYNQAKAAQEQGGAVTYVHPTMVPTFDATSSRELPVDLALGQVDAMDVVSNVDEIASVELWYRLLSCGLRLAISAGTDSFTNVADHYTPGGGRVYVHSGARLDYAEWIRNYKRGRSFASNGPVVFFTANGREPGEEIRLPARPQNVRVKAEVRSHTPLDKIEVVVNGRVVLSRPSGPVDEEIPLDRSSWIAVRALGPWHRLILNDVQAFAHTSPVYVLLGGQRIASASDARFHIDWIERLIARIQERGKFSTPERKQEVIELCRRAIDVYREVERTAEAQRSDN